MNQLVQPIRTAAYAAAAVTVIVALAATARPASAAVLAQYQFTGGSTASSGDSGLAVPNPFVANSGANEGGVNADIAFSTPSSNAFLRSDATGSTQAAALADDDFFTFTVDAAPSTVLNLTSILFDFGASNSSGSSASTTVYLQSSIDGLGTGGTVLFTQTRTIGTGTASAGNLVAANSGTPIDLSAAQFQGLTSITFRFSYSDTTTQDASYINRLDNVVLNGEVAAAPVPAPAALPAGLAMLGLIAARRRRPARA